MTCDLCGDSGTLRDGSACPHCTVTRWKALGTTVEITRPKRTVWVRPEAVTLAQEQAARK